MANASITATKAAASVATPGSGIFNFLNTVITTLLNPFLNPPPVTPGPIVPMAWAFLGWVRRDLFNQAPTISYNEALNVQTGQTVVGNVGATDAEGDVLTYTVTQAPQYGTVEINQATGEFTYTPDAINYTAEQTDAFTVVVSDGKINLLSLFTPHVASATEGVSVLSPALNRVILTMDPAVTKPVNPRYAPDGNSIYFAATPTAGGRQEIYQINIDGTNTVCLTCGVAPSETTNLGKPIPFSDGTGRLVVLVSNGGQIPPRYDIYEDGVQGPQLIPIVAPPGAPGVISLGAMREVRISPDGTKVLFSRITLTQATGVMQIVPVVGTLGRGASTYEITDSRVVYPVGEGKQWTPDGKGVLLLGGSYDEGNADDIQVDLATGDVTRTTYNLDYDEDLDLSPNQQWIAVGSLRSFNALTPMTRIVRPSFLPAYVSAPVYGAYSAPVNISNQEWAVSQADEANLVNGLPLFVTGDGWAARSMPSWNANGTAVTFWESGVTDTTQSRLVIANLTYTTSVGAVAQDRTTPNPTWAPTLSTYVPAPTPLPAVGTYDGPGGGTAVVSEAPDPNNTQRTIRTVVYTNYVNQEGMILNGTEASDYLANRNSVHYLADITVTGTHTGYLRADANINPFQQSLTGFITSDLDGDVQTLPDTAQATQDQQNA